MSYSRPMNEVDIAQACHEACRAAGETRVPWDRLDELRREAAINSVKHYMKWEQAEPMNRTDRIFSAITRQLRRFL